MLTESVQYNYIYNENGVPEYVVLPFKLWESVKDFVQTKKKKDTEIKENQTVTTENFNAKDFYGILSPLNLDIETELKTMREEWNRTI